ncbi:MAG TPA: hypothetical protein VLD67_09615 [Vicinamibacterales bacterium]|nr:hypothetical protein [Vicinamibacterales bacterium]
MKAAVHPVLIGLVMVVAGCQATPLSPTRPSTAADLSPAPQPPSPQPPRFPNPWNLTTVLTSVTGPDNCFTRQQRRRIGASTEWLLSVTRGASSLHLLYDVRNWPLDHAEYDAAINGDDFAGSSDSMPVSFPACPDGTVLTGSGDGMVSGRFTPDGHEITAQEVWIYRFSSGEVRLFMDWIARQP